METIDLETNIKQLEAQAEQLFCQWQRMLGRVEVLRELQQRGAHVSLPSGEGETQPQEQPPQAVPPARVG
jgi:hypothetical protein